MLNEGEEWMVVLEESHLRQPKFDKSVKDGGFTD
jgi:hypothetical protein